jgi:hypothetical protein
VAPLPQELRNRIILAHKCCHGFKGKFKFHFLTLSPKLRLYETLLRPLLIYGSESWMLTRSNEESFRVFRRKMFQRIYGPVCENGFWCIRYNSESYQLFSELDIVKTIKIGRL